MASIFYASSLPSPPIPEGTDKTFHLSGYFFFAIVVVRAVAGGLPRRIGVRTALIAFAIAAGYGATDEFHQRFVPGRSADVYDWLADAIGVALAMVGCIAWGHTQGTSQESEGPSHKI
jgi:VanZ family protein